MGCLGETDTKTFLKKYWQQKPLLIRKAFPDIQSPITADELAGLACEQHVNSRLVLENTSDKQWQVEFGPFEESRFSKLPASGWSLLVSDIERHVPDSKSLLSSFRFIPDWRIDDLMVSYAPAGGSVGAHTDAYDVFLIQLSGHRLWKINENFSDETLEDTDLCILKNFTAEQEWLLEAGDMLYLPPNVAHHGIAQSLDDNDTEHCMTASVGFRAPSIKEMTNDYIHFVNENFVNENRDNNKRFQDKSASSPAHHAEISEQTVTDFLEYLKKGLTPDRDTVKRWLGHYCSDNKTFEQFTDEPQQVNLQTLTQLATQTGLSQSSYSNFLFSRTAQSAILFVDGNSYDTSLPFAEILCNEHEIDFDRLSNVMSESDEEVLLLLFNSGAIVV